MTDSAAASVLEKRTWGAPQSEQKGNHPEPENRNDGTGVPLLSQIISSGEWRAGIPAAFKRVDQLAANQMVSSLPCVCT
jgi:hypothetical protein